MRKTSKITITSLALLTAVLLGLSGCKRPGTAERVGKKIDQTVEKAGQEVQKAGQQIDTAARKIGKDFQGK